MHFSLAMMRGSIQPQPVGLYEYREKSENANIYVRKYLPDHEKSIYSEITNKDAL